MSERLVNALDELKKASQDIYGEDVILGLRFDIRLCSSGKDKTDMTIEKFFEIDIDESDDIDGNIK